MGFWSRQPCWFCSPKALFWIQFLRMKKIITAAELPEHNICLSSEAKRDKERKREKQKAGGAQGREKSRIKPVQHSLFPARCSRRSQVGNAKPGS